MFVTSFTSSGEDSENTDITYLHRRFLLVDGANVTGKKKANKYFQTLTHCVKGYLGLGLFASGAAFMNSGILLGPMLMICMALIFLHCQHLLIRACARIENKEQVKVFPTFAETVQYTLEDSDLKWLKKHSKTFGILTDVFILYSQYRYCVIYMIFAGTHIREIAEDYGWAQSYHVFLVLNLIPLWILVFLENLKLLAPVSLCANIMLCLGSFIIMYYSVVDVLPPISSRPLVADVHKIPLFFGIFSYTFQGASFIIFLRMEMKDTYVYTSRFGVLNVAMLISLTLGALLGFFSYWEWGKNLENIFVNLPKGDPSVKAPKILVSLGILLSYPLHKYIAFMVSYPRFYHKLGPFKHPDLVMNTYKSVTVVLTYLVANIPSHIGRVFEFLEAISGAMLNLMLPALLELVMFYGELTYLIIVKDAIIITLAIAAIIIGPLYFTV